MAKILTVSRKSHHPIETLNRETTENTTVQEDKLNLLRKYRNF